MKRNRQVTFLFLLLGGAALRYAAGVGDQAPLPMIRQGRRHAAPVFAARDLTGGSWSLGDQRGNIVLVNFSATWCPPCRGETPYLVRIANRYAGRGLSLVGVSLDQGNGAEIGRFVEEYHVPYRIVLPVAGKPLPFPVQALPTTFLIDQRGNIANYYEGAVSENTLKANIDMLFAEK